jgi:hypothetical protein
MAAFVHILVPEDGGAVVSAKGKVEASVGNNFVDDSQVIEDFEASGLEAFSP